MYIYTYYLTTLAGYYYNAQHVHCACTHPICMYIVRVAIHVGALRCCCVVCHLYCLITLLLSTSVHVCTVCVHVQCVCTCTVPTFIMIHVLYMYMFVCIYMYYVFQYT